MAQARNDLKGLAVKAEFKTAPIASPHRPDRQPSPPRSPALTAPIELFQNCQQANHNTILDKLLNPHSLALQRDCPLRTSETIDNRLWPVFWPKRKAKLVA